MHDLLTHIITVFFGFFAIMNPIANTAAFTALAGNKTKPAQAQIAARALIITFVIICVFTVLGKAIFQVFGISLSALRITGGIIIFVVGYHMLNGSGSNLHSADAEDDKNIAVSPLAIPLLAGPGTIATAMNYTASGNLIEMSITISVFALLCAITYFCFIFSSSILNAIGQSGLGIVTRLMGLILAVMGTQMVMSGTLTALKDSQLFT
jgi:multiple antibiotic resistance protein